MDSLQPTPTEFIPSPQSQIHTPPNQLLELTTPVRPIPSTENRSNLLAALNLKSRLAIKNIALFKLGIESNKETAGVTLESDLILNQLEKKTIWVNRDIALLILAMNGVIPVLEPTGQVPPPDVLSFEESSDQEGEK